MKVGKSRAPYRGLSRAAEGFNIKPLDDN